MINYSFNTADVNQMSHSRQRLLLLNNTNFVHKNYGIKVGFSYILKIHVFDIKAEDSHQYNFFPSL